MTLPDYPPHIYAAITITGFLMPCIAYFISKLQSH